MEINEKKPIPKLPFQKLVPNFESAQKFKKFSKMCRDFKANLGIEKPLKYGKMEKHIPNFLNVDTSLNSKLIIYNQNQIKKHSK